MTQNETQTELARLQREFRQFRDQSDSIAALCWRIGVVFLLTSLIIIGVGVWYRAANFMEPAMTMLMLSLTLNLVWQALRAPQPAVAARADRPNR